jgi:hypothetical protein
MTANLITDGSTLPFMGKLYTVRLFSSLTPKIVVDEAVNELKIFLCTNAPPQPAPFIKAWYKQSAAARLKARTHFWGEKMNISVNKISIKEQKTRWGSCSSLGNVNYNWRIIMAPPPVIDYLIIHELSHRVHMNHSKEFWQHVAKFSPQHNKCRQWLREHTDMILNCI